MKASVTSSATCSCSTSSVSTSAPVCGAQAARLTACVIGGGVLGHLGEAWHLSREPVIGASGGGSGLLVCWCLVHARRTIRLFGILPLTGQQALLLSVGLEVLLAVSPGGAAYRRPTSEA